jgi:protein phosphatase PTC7
MILILEGNELMKKGIRGSSTCILALLYHSTLCLANLGDCALLLIRNGKVILRTTEMQHAFNHPLQVCHSP